MQDLPLLTKQQIIEDLLPADHTNMDDPANKGLVSLIDLYLSDGPYYMYDPEVSTSNVDINLPFTNNIASMCFRDQIGPPSRGEPRWYYTHAVAIHETPTQCVIQLSFNGCAAHSALSVYFIKEL
jgi:hypothetical protein